MGRFFISHASPEAEQAAQLQDALGAGNYAFLDTDDQTGIQPGDVWAKKLFLELRTCDAIIVLLSDAYLASKWCHTELAVALDRGKRVFWIETAPGLERPAELGPIQGVKFHESFATGVEELVKTIEASNLFAKRDGALLPNQPPYPGLHPMQVEDAAVFFGRQAAELQLRDKLSRQATTPGGHLLVVHGGSGSGKSSLVRAGLTARLRGEPEAWIALTPFTPGRRPLDRLLQCLLEFAPPGIDETECRSRLLADGGLCDVVRWLYTEHAKSERRVLLVVDQAEDLVTEPRPVDVGPFADVLAGGLADDSVLSLILVLRSDRLADLQQLPGIASHLRETFLLNPLPANEVTAVIVEPARLADMDFQDDLAAVIAHDAEQTSTTGIDALPLLAYTLRELYDDAVARDSKEMSKAKYEELGGLATAISRLAADAESGLSPAASSRLEPLLTRFVTLDQGTRASSRIVARDTLTDPNDLVVVKALEDAHLITGDETLRLAHDRLFEAWPTLGRVVEEHRDDLELETRLQRQAEDYYEKKGELIQRERTLGDAQSWLAKSTDPTLKGSKVEKYIEESGRHLRRRRLVQRSAVAAVVVIALVFLFLALFANAQRHQARAEANTALGGELASQSSSFSATNFGLSAALAMTASTLQQASDERSALISATQEPLRSVIYDQSGKGNTPVAVNTVVVNPDGTEVAAVDSGDNLLLVDGQNSSVIARRHTSSPIYAVALSTDGTELATGDRRGDVTLWPTTEGLTASRVLNGCTTGKQPLCKVISSVAISPNGLQVAAGTYANTMELCPVSSGACKVVPTGNTVRAITYSPNGDIIATSDTGGHVDLWNTAGVRTKSWQFRDGSPALAVAFNPDGHTVAAGDGGGRIVLWNVKTDVQTEPFPIAPGQIIGLAWTDSGSVLLSADSDGTTNLYNPTGGSQILKLPGNGASLRSVASTEDGQLVVTGDDEGHLTLWHAPLANTLLLADDNDLSSIAVDPSGLLVAGADDVGRVWIRNIGDSWLMTSKTLVDHSTVNAVVFVDGGREAVTGDNNGHVRLWDVGSGQMVLQYPMPKTNVARQVQALAVDPVDSTVAAAQASGLVTLLRATSPCAALSTDEPGVANDNLKSVAINRDGTLLATGGSRGVVELFDLATCKELRPITVDGSTILSLAFSLSTDTLAIGDEAGTISLWRLQGNSRSWLGTIDDGSAVDSLTFVDRGRLLASADAVGNAVLWRVSDEGPVARLPSDSNQLNSVAFDGRTNELLVADHLGYVRLYSGSDWSSPLSALRGQLCREVHQGLSPAQWGQYVAHTSFVDVCPSGPDRIDQVPVARR